MRKKLLIIGGTGFFGKSILEYLQKVKFYKTIDVVILSRNVKKKFSNIKKIIPADVSKIRKIPKADFVIYCALLKNLKQDTLAVKNYINLAKKFHLNSKILYISSGAVYGDLSKNTRKVKENNYNYKQYKIGSYKKKYSTAKIINELKFKELGKLGLDVSIARCFTFVGKYLSDNKQYIIKDFINSVLKKKDIYIKANYKIIRSYLHSDNLAKFLLKILSKASSDCPIYNCGSDDAVDLRKLAQFLSLKYNIKINSRNIEKKHYIDRYVPDISKFRKDFRFYKKLSSYKAIIKTINQIKKQNFYEKI